MTDFNWAIVLIVIIVLVGLDKALTLMNILRVEKNFPQSDPLSIEKNPIAKSFFKQFGLWGGTVLYFFASILTFILALLLLSWTLSLFGLTNNKSIALYVLIIWYGFVISNNFYFFLKFSRVVP
jgi:hypothetical protein